MCITVNATLRNINVLRIHNQGKVFLENCFLDAQEKYIHIRKIKILENTIL